MFRAMSIIIHRLIVALALAAGIAPAFAQAPAVPALPDTERRTTYSISASICTCSVGFQLYGDSTDYANWLEVFVNGLLVPQSGNWTITSPTGSLSTIPRPITDAVLTFTTAQTGTVQIVGARRPRRTSQFQESQPVPTRNFNVVFSDITATLRELWDKTNDFTGRSVLAPPGETLGLLPVLASRANMGACFDSGGNLTSCVSVASSTITAGSGILFTGTGPTVISNNITAGAGIKFTGTNPIVISVPGNSSVVSLADYAVGDCVTDDTTAFNNALAAAFAGSRRLYIPKPSGGCWLVGAINQTAKPGMFVYGDGDTSVLKINGFSPTNKNWWDMTGSADTRFANFKVTGTSAIKPKVIFFAAADNVVNILRGIDFDHVNIDAYSTEGHLYAFNVAYDNGVTSVGAGGMTCRNSVWFQRANGGSASSANPSLQTAVAIFDGINSRALASDYATVSAGGAGSQSINLTNCNFIDFPPTGVGGGTLDANSGLVLVTAGQFEMTNGSVQCLGGACVVIYTNTEGVHFSSVVLKNSDGAGGAASTLRYYFYLGGGVNGFIILDNVFLSDLPNVGGNAGYIAFDVTLTQVAHLKVRGPDIGLNTYSNKFINTVGGCGGHVGATKQLSGAYIEFFSGAVQMCDSIDASTILVNPTVVTLISGGATDASHHF